MVRDHFPYTLSLEFWVFSTVLGIFIGLPQKNGKSVNKVPYKYWLILVTIRRKRWDFRIRIITIYDEIIFILVVSSFLLSLFSAVLVLQTLLRNLRHCETMSKVEFFDKLNFKLQTLVSPFSSYYATLHYTSIIGQWYWVSQFHWYCVGILKVCYEHKSCETRPIRSVSIIFL